MRRSSSARLTSSSGEAAVAGEPDRLGDPLVGLEADGDVERGRRHLRAQRLGDRVAADQQLGGVASPLGATSRRPVRRARSAAARPARRRMALALLGRRRRALARAAPRAFWPPEPTCAPFFGLRIAPWRCELPAISLILQASSAGRPGCPRSRRRPRRAGRGSRRRRRSPCARGPPRAARSATCDERVDDRRQVARPARRPRRAGRVPSTPVIASTGAERARAPSRSSPSASAVLPCAHGVVQHRERGRDAEVVVHRRGRTRRGTGAVGSASPPTSLARVDEVLDPPVRRGGLVQRRRRVLDRRAVVRRAEVVAQLDRTPLLDDLARPAACCRATSTSSRRPSSPSRCASSTARSRRRPPTDCAISFSWCGKMRSRPPPWMSNVGPRYFVGHRRALEVPARPAAAPRRRPRASARPAWPPSTARSRAGRACGRRRPSRRPAASRRASARTARRRPGSERTSK